MIYRIPREHEEGVFDELAKHPLQTFAWGEFRKQTGVEVERLIGFEGSEAKKQLQVTFHQIPKLPYTIGYLPRGDRPDEVMLQALFELGKKKKAIMIKLEPNVSTPPYGKTEVERLRNFLEKDNCEKGKAQFTPHTFLIDLTPDEELLLQRMKGKTRYNIGLAERYGVEVVEDSTNEGFLEYLKLLELTTKRQQFYAHTKDYQTKMWKVMSEAGVAKILKANYEGQTLAAWVLFVLGDYLYYPYGASSREHREVMASNLLMWEAMKYGKSLGLKWFDLWGALGPDPEKSDPWYGFHRFKEGYGGVLAEFVGTYDLVIEPQMYQVYRVIDRWRWKWLRIKSRLGF